MRQLKRAALLLAVAASATTAPLHAQAPILPTTPQLQEVVRLAQETYGDSARSMIARILVRTPPTDPLYPEVLFTAASVAKTGDEMRANFAKIVVDYPNSAWADKALLRLAQLDYGGGKYDGTIEKITRFFMDYPSSLVLPSAALWGARAAFDRQQVQQACDWLTRGIARVGGDIELKNQLVFAKQRCVLNPGVEMAPVKPDSLRLKAGDTASRLPPPRDTATPKTPVKPPVTAAKPAASPWRVQVAAVSDKKVIARLVQKIESAGFKAYQVAGPRGLTKVQAGPFTTRDQARVALPKVKAATGGAPFITQAP